VIAEGLKEMLGRRSEEGGGNSENRVETGERIETEIRLLRKRTRCRSRTTRRKEILKEETPTSNDHAPPHTRHIDHVERAVRLAGEVHLVLRRRDLPLRLCRLVEVGLKCRRGWERA
jgi:hypothetical protein